MGHHLKRRDFVKALVAGSLSTPMLLEGLSQSILAQPKFKKIDLIWIRGQNSAIHDPGFFNIPELHEFINKFFDIVPLSKIGNRKLNKKNKPILMVSGSINRENRTIEKLRNIVSRTRLVILLGNEACYGAKDIDNWIHFDKELLLPDRIPHIKLPGVPVSARQVLGTLNHLVLFGIPKLDVERRPKMFFNKLICDRCEYRSNFEKGDFLSYYGEKEGCLYLLGCKGPIVKNSCPVDHWNETNQWCVKAGSPCTACSESSYPDNSGLGLYGQVSSNIAGVNSKMVQHTDNIIKGTLAMTVAGIVIHAGTRKSSSPVEIKMKQPFRGED
ncbi:MAG: hypothetical protein GY786_09345 [Proteobacteria bacterium]|nr:hypothetical protein [Pseudomonadota bacterium]